MGTHTTDTTDLIVSDPEIMGGTPVFKGTRVPVKNLIDYLKGGHTLDEFLESFPTVEGAQAKAVLDLVTELLMAQTA